MSPRTFRPLTLALPLLGLSACGFGGTVRGTVDDYETGEPIVGAEVTSVEHGWGFRGGSLVWDADKSTTVTTDADGAFTATFRYGTSVRLRVRRPGYQAFEADYRRGADARIRLKRRIEGVRPLPDGFLRMGLREDGTTYGWDFSRGEIATAPEEADLLPVAIGEGMRDSIVFRTPGEGGVRFVPASRIGVDNLFLVFTDEAPADGYEQTSVIDFESEGGVYFVRTRDGARYAKFEFKPSAFSMSADPGVVRDLSLHFVYNPDGSRNLLYQVPDF